MKRLRVAAALLQKWFTESDAIRAFTILRAGMALVLIVKNLAELSSLGMLYGQDGVLPWSISDYTTLSIFPKLSVVAGALWKLGISADTTLVLVFVTYTLALVWILIRPQNRLPVFIAWYLHLMFFGASFKSVYGLDCFANIVLFYCLIGANGDWRSFVRSSAPGTYSASLVHRLFQLNVCIVYASAAIAKAHGTDWWTGESIWRAVSQPQFAGILPMTWLHTYPFVAKFAGWSTVVVEGGYPLAVWIPRLRKYWLAAILLMHASICIVLNLRLFGAIMIVMNLAAFGVPQTALVFHWIYRFPSRLRNPAQAQDVSYT